MLRPRRLAVAAAAVLGGALLVSDAYAYRVAMLAPTDRLGELTAIDKRFAGQGPVLVNEFEEYVKHYMRHSRGSDPYESWTAGRAQLRDPRLPVAAHAYDLDQMTTAFIERWPLIALRRSPAESRPPSNYALAWRGRFYEVWRRNGPAPALHRPYGAPPFSAVSTPSCRAIRALGAKRRLVAAWQPAPVLYDIARQTTLPPGWYRDAVDPTVLVTTKGGTVDATGPSRSLFPGTVWLRGRSFRKDEISIDGKRVGIARHLNGPNQWIEAGPAPKSLARTHKVELDRPTRSLRPGDAGADHIGPIAITQGRDERLIGSSPGHAARLCNRPLDWIDVR
jgi:hypothetical protein